MQTSLPEAFVATSRGQRAGEILRSCVHCGFCNATCPTYQLLGDELDGPRGRIYLIKEMLEEGEASATAATHLDRCLTCRACETTCPSGVAYGELLEIGRDYLETHKKRGWLARLQRGWLKRVVPNPARFRRWARLGALARPFLPRRLARQIPRLPRSQADAAPAFAGSATGKVLLLEGCVQRVSTPEVNRHLELLLASRQVEVVRADAEGCCGGLALHLGDEPAALAAIRSNLEAIGPYLDEVEAVLSTASGCGVTMQDYARLLGPADELAAVATTLVGKFADVGEYLVSLGGEWQPDPRWQRVALHLPCTLQHGQRRGQHPGALLAAAGYELTPVGEGHLCCGSAGTYAVLQPEMAEALGGRKIRTLTAGKPDVIATGNIGCQLHLSDRGDTSVVHWLTLLAAGEHQQGSEP